MLGSKIKRTRHDDYISKECELAQTNVSSGGWYAGRKWLTNKKIKAAEKRWLKLAFDEGKKQPDYDGWIEHQCGGCMYFACWKDFGLCWCKESPLDGHVVFEHSGCDHHSWPQEHKDD